MDVEAMQARMRTAFELRELMIAMRREALARQYPDESAEQIDARLREWVLDPGPPPARLVGRDVCR